MIFATDLDRTLIYSHLFLENAACTYQLIEKKGEKPIAYMSDKAIALIKQLHQKAHIIPITLRNEEEFHRIDLFREVIKPEVYVTNNGGTIYYQGQEDEEWTTHISSQMAALRLSHEQIKECFLALYQGKIEKMINCGNLVWLFMGEKDHIDEAGVSAFRGQYEAQSWRIDVSGRKIYVYPYFVTKWEAVSYIKKKYFNETIFAAGDSIFDKEMVEKADYGMVPKACYIEDVVGKHVSTTEHVGMRAAEDILVAALKISQQEGI